MVMDYIEQWSDTVSVGMSCPHSTLNTDPRTPLASLISRRLPHVSVRPCDLSCAAVLTPAKARRRRS